MTTREQPLTCSDEPMWELWLSFLWLPSVTAATEAGLLEAIATSPASADELAAQLGLNARACRAVLRMLAALGLLVGRAGRFYLSELASQYLLADGPCNWAHVFTSYQEQLVLHGEILSRLRAGSGRAEETAGPGENPDDDPEKKPVDAWASGQLERDMAVRIARFMHAHSLSASRAAASNGDWQGVRRLLDVGGGSGCFATAIVQAHPGMRGTVLALPAMTEVAAEYIANAGLEDSVDTLALDMFRHDWPRGYDTIFFSNVFHDWDMPTCRTLAQKAFDALPTDGRIVLHEMLLDDSGNGPRTAVAFSLLMMIRTEGQQFTYAELSTLLASVGFCDVRVRTTHNHYALVSGCKP